MILIGIYIYTYKDRDVTCIVLAKLLAMIPQALNIAPHAVTYRQLYFWHKALVIGAVAKASVVMLPGIQAARATEVPTLNVSIMLKKKHPF